MMSCQLDKCYFGMLAGMIKYKDKESDYSALLKKGRRALAKMVWLFLNHSM